MASLIVNYRIVIEGLDSKDEVRFMALGIGSSLPAAYSEARREVLSMRADLADSIGEAPERADPPLVDIRRAGREEDDK